MTFSEAMMRLEAAGSEQTRKTYRRHGASEPLFGVSCAALKVLKKAIGRDHALARSLWATKNYDARILATMVADPRALSDEELHDWVVAIDCYGVGDAVAALAAETGRIRELAERYRSDEREFVGAFGWQMVSRLAAEAGAADDGYFLDRLGEVESRIHSAPNRVRYSMNSAIIGIGIRNERLRKAALATAGRVGMVEVDHGETSCKTPDAAAYIEKTVAYRESRVKKS
ncbi:MAG: DNA alkylation repair protein [Fimbriimonadaceae bacterium]|nr:DNA alkylation repair protein [Fimbriimonadaceae bacterium]